MTHYTIDIHDAGATSIAESGGKGASLNALSRVGGIRVPPGFCVTTRAFHETVARAGIDGLLERLSGATSSDLETVRALSAEIRSAIERTSVGAEVIAEVTDAVERMGSAHAYAVRSSATAEDLPTASFAGQQDSFLDVTGVADILLHVRRCWASLFTERAVAYRLQRGIDQRAVRMAVVVQRMVNAECSGVMFTADPVSGNRHVTTIEAVAGLGDALVSGRATPDTFSVRDGAVTAHTTAAPRETPLLTDADVIALAAIGRTVEAHFGRPQDIEWCFANGEFHIVQSRPITTLFPIPAASDGGNHVYVSVGHPQMFTDAMKPLGLSVWKLTAAPMVDAGGRLFVDVTHNLAKVSRRPAMLAMLGRGDPLVRDALETVLSRPGLVPEVPSPAEEAHPKPWDQPPAAIENDPSIVSALIEESESALAALQQRVAGKTEAALFDALAAEFEEDKRLLFTPMLLRTIMAGFEAVWWINDRMEAWLGEKNAADLLTQSLPDNVTSAMGLDLLDVADAVRPHAAVVEFLRTVTRDDFLERLPQLDGGRESQRAIQGWLDLYGMRCPGEIDITRPRWSERPTMLLPLLLGNIGTFAPGEARRRFEEGKRNAERKEAELLASVRLLPEGEERAAETKRMIDRVRTFAGYREYPKYARICRYWVYKQAMLEEAERLVRAGVFERVHDMDWLSFGEFQQAAVAGSVSRELIRAREEEFRVFESLAAPRILTSEGEGFNGRYHRDDVPTGALVGLAVSAGTVEGRARVVLDMSEATLESGDILVTKFTDPSWTPLFIAVKGLVTEVGGLMTHGAVIAREYGLPAVVGVPDATRLIRDGQLIRVDGTGGWVELLS